ncbi:MAG: hypothetical protein DHS20C16_26400 [Phycisphaerae bacterium]|nr:MAG: hypothetical protein DHS20C16_26400 [Phycisphaerae bacterium]
MSSENKPTKKTPACLLALGRDDLPATVALESGEYRLDKVFKHDFFAATARYVGDNGAIVLKIGRKAWFGIVPLGWIGRWHAWHESGCYGALDDLDAVPNFLGRIGKHGLAHAYIEGHPLRKGEHVPDDFFDRLRGAIAAIHERGMAYVDLEKCENVIVGDDGQPYLIDFQISWRLSKKFGGELWPLRLLRKRLQQSDWYHIRKLQRRTRRDQMSDADLKASYHKPFHVRAHGYLTRPITKLRRRILNKIDPVQKRGERGRVNE